MATTYPFANGQYRQTKQVWRYVNGSWLNLKEIWMKDNSGTWRLVFQYAYNFTGTVSGNNYNLASAASADGWDGVAPLAATLTVSGTVGSTTAASYDWQGYLNNYPDVAANAPGPFSTNIQFAQYHFEAFGNSEGRVVPVIAAASAFDTGALPSGSTITLNIPTNGMILGTGGAGGWGGIYVTGNKAYAPSTPGVPGGTAMIVRSPITIVNNGTIGGGGGGGGGGAGAGGSQAYDDPGGGGGGGAGSIVGAGGGSSRNGTYPGQPGTTAAGGAGGTLQNQGSKEWASASPGGAGGGLGAAGATSANTNGGNGLPGGAAGVAVAGSGNVTWQVYGNVYGSLA